MYLISARGYKKIGEIWSGMKHVHKSLGVKNMSNLILKEMCSIYETKNFTNKQIQKYKMTERDIFEKYNLSKDELNTKTNKNVSVKNDVMSTVLKHCRGKKKIKKKKRGKRKIDGFT